MPAFNPLSRAAAPRLRAFRKAVLRSIRGMWRQQVPPAPQLAEGGLGAARNVLEQDILWIVRKHARRNIENEPLLGHTLLANPRVRRIALEGIPLADQMVLFSRARVLVAVHGQAMTWVLFLGPLLGPAPTPLRDAAGGFDGGLAPMASPYSARGGGAAAAVEIMPRGLINHIYRDLSRTLGVHYEEVAATPIRGCGGGSTDARLACNVTVRIKDVESAVGRAAAWTSSQLPGK